MAVLPYLQQLVVLRMPLYRPADSKQLGSSRIFGALEFLVELAVLLLHLFAREVSGKEDLGPKSELVWGPNRSRDAAVWGTRRIMGSLVMDVLRILCQPEPALHDAGIIIAGLRRLHTAPANRRK